MKVPFAHRPTVVQLVFWTALVAVFVLELLMGTQVVGALNAAGVTGGTPIAGLGGFIDKVKGNLIWVAVTVVSIAVIGIGLLFLFGHSRAQDYAIKALIGAAIIASGSGIVA